MSDELLDVEMDNEPETNLEDKTGGNAIPENADVAHTAAFKGLLSDKQRETQRRQELEQRVSELQAEIAADRSQKPSETEEPAETELMTFGDFKKLQAKQKTESQQESEKRQRIEMNRRFAQAESMARDKYTAEKTGKGLDFDTVFRDGFEPLVRMKPHLLQIVAQDENPAEMAYTLGLTHPELAQRIEAVRTSRLLEKITKSGRSFRKGAGSLGKMLDREEMDDSAAIEELISKPESELIKMIDEAEE